MASQTYDNIDYGNICVQSIQHTKLPLFVAKLKFERMPL